MSTKTDGDYIILGPADTIQEGDEYVLKPGYVSWLKVNNQSYWGKTVAQARLRLNENAEMQVRRKVEKNIGLPCMRIIVGEYGPVSDFVQKHLFDMGYHWYNPELGQQLCQHTGDHFYVWPATKHLTTESKAEVHSYYMHEFNRFIKDISKHHKKPPMKLGEYSVEFFSTSSQGIMVGCLAITADEVKQIYDRLFSLPE